jgi:hypothetical protein
MKRMFYPIVMFLGLLRTTPAQSIPKELWGRWVVRKEVPTTAIACWGEEQAERLIGTEVEYSAGSFRWREVVTKNPTAEISGRGTNSSQITFEQLGINSGKVTQVIIHHPAANITKATVEIPGDSVLIKDKNTIIFSVCSVYFEAERSVTSSGK